MDVALVATDADLETIVLGKDNLQALLPEEWRDPNTGEKTARTALQRVLDSVLLALSKRRPPIFQEDLTTPSELRDVVCYGALEIIYNGAIQHDDSPNVVRAKRASERYQRELNALQPTVRQRATASGLSIQISRG